MDHGCYDSAFSAKSVVIVSSSHQVDLPPAIWPILLTPFTIVPECCVSAPYLSSSGWLSPVGRLWLDRNLGAGRAATSSTDEDSYGDLFQWGCAADGHQRRDSKTTTTLSRIDTPTHGSFILNSSSPNDWRSEQNDNLWQGVDGINNPCPPRFVTLGREDNESREVGKFQANIYSE